MYSIYLITYESGIPQSPSFLIQQTFIFSICLRVYSVIYIYVFLQYNYKIIVKRSNEIYI